MKKYLVGAVLVCVSIYIIQISISQRTQTLTMGTPISATSSVSLITKDFELGATGTDVIILQNFLKNEGYLRPSDSQYGVYDIYTGNAVIAYKTAKGISPADTRFSPAVRSAINAQIKKRSLLLLPNTSPTPLIKNLELRATGTDVLILQDFLRTKGFLSKTPTGVFDLMTKNAVISFQVSQNITPADGFVGSVTRSAINTISKAKTVKATSSIVSACVQTVTIDTYTFKLETCSYRGAGSVKTGVRFIPITIIPSDPKVSFRYIIENVGFIPNSILGPSSGTGKGTTTIKKIFRSSTLSANGKNTKVYSGQFKIKIFLGKASSSASYLYQNVNVTVKP
jgi:peptidoglycan hydrolase-like protein with peptidoglycan-binding domain